MNLIWCVRLSELSNAQLCNMNLTKVLGAEVEPDTNQRGADIISGGQQGGSRGGGHFGGEARAPPGPHLDPPLIRYDYMELML